MKCEEHQVALQELLAGELSEERRLALEEHVRHCPACERDLAAYRVLFDALPQVPEPEIPARLHGDIMLALRAHQPAWKQRETRTQVLVRRTVAAVLAAAFGLSLSYALWESMGRIGAVVAHRVSLDMVSFWNAARDLWRILVLLGNVLRNLEPAGEGLAETLRRSAEPLASWGPLLVTAYTAALCLGGYLIWRAFRRANERGFEHAA